MSHEEYKELERQIDGLAIITKGGFERIEKEIEILKNDNITIKGEMKLMNKKLDRQEILNKVLKGEDSE